MADDREIDRWLAEMAEDEAPLSPGLRAAILDGLPAPQRWVWWRPALVWTGPMAAALCGIWLGLAQPALVLQAVPGLGEPVAVGGADPLDEWEGWL
ncbi:hypothetical protein [Jannaschia seohaensis]|uniref:Uncharacterized protein n=1 Tax=Jannaschia seohaensis TaxID=475081 RepID=A0A2Y9AH01_9RHOB|nr:hypothetical protein [Jannaschia seohaensis]PWJ21237.1 hypothetical protein BCF38_102487 [Jannaschia seohaensis]SSA41647.1 hypothetical protein SAMN05421539_102487 [Jannaschia seohaensis]